VEGARPANEEAIMRSIDRFFRSVRRFNAIALAGASVLFMIIPNVGLNWTPGVHCSGAPQLWLAKH
jgi:hypothetical protein